MTAKTRRKVQVHLCRIDSESGRPLFLVLRRTPEKNGVWQPVTGNVDSGEELQKCACRELEEETGITDVSNCVPVGEFTFEKKGVTFNETVFLARTRQTEVTLSWEHDSFRWAPYEEARKLIDFDSNKSGLDQAMSRMEH